MAMEQLIIRLGPSTKVQWALFVDGKITSGPHTSPISEIASKVKRAEVIAIVPGVDVSLTQVNMPKMASNKLQRAIPFALEEQLTEDVNQLHFSTGSRSGESLTVAVTHNQKMKLWYEQLMVLPEEQLALKQMLPDNLMLPRKPESWAVLIEDGLAYVRTGAEQGFVIEQENVFEVLRGVLHTSVKKPKSITLYADEMLFDDEQQAILNVKIEQQKAVNLLQVATIGDLGLNLLHSQYAVDRNMIPTSKLRYITVAIVAAWLMVLLSANLIKLNYLQSHEAKLDQQIAVIYKELFPNATTVASPRKRVERLLASNNVRSANSAFLALMGKVAPTLTQMKSLVVQEVLFQDQALQIKLEIDDFSQLDNLSNKLKANGLALEQRGATKAGKVIQANLIVRAS